MLLKRGQMLDAEAERSRARPKFWQRGRIQCYEAKAKLAFRTLWPKALTSLSTHTLCFCYFLKLVQAGPDPGNRNEVFTWSAYLIPGVHTQHTLRVEITCASYSTLHRARLILLWVTILYYNLSRQYCNQVEVIQANSADGSKGRYELWLIHSTCE